jgi:hypothetical protein
MKWITRERLRVDRVASAWLILRFVDPQAEFLFAPREQVLDVAQQQGATPFHVQGSELGQREGKTGFDAIIAKYGLTDLGLLMVADIVRGADHARSPDAPPEADGLRALTHGFFLLNLPDLESIDRQAPMFDALYAYCQQRAARG